MNFSVRTLYRHRHNDNRQTDTQTYKRTDNWSVCESTMACIHWYQDMLSQNTYTWTVYTWLTYVMSWSQLNGSPVVMLIACSNTHVLHTHTHTRAHVDRLLSSTPTTHTHTHSDMGPVWQNPIQSEALQARERGSISKQACIKFAL